VPGIVAALVEPFLGILADIWRRRVLIVGGGAVFGLTLLLIAAGHHFWALMIAFAVQYPASGAFVSVSQAALMDHDPARREHNMARWTFAGSVGVVAGPLTLGAIMLAGGMWRELFAAFAALTFVLAAAAYRHRYPNHHSPGERSASADPDGDPVPLTFRDGLRQARRALRRRDVLRWIALLQFSDLMLDVLYGFLALYFVDVVGLTASQASLAVAVWTGVGLVGDFLIIPLLERVPGLAYLRASAAVVLLVFPAFLLAPWFGIKLVLLGTLGLLNAGWYAILMAQLYAAMPNQSGTALAVNNVGGLAGSLIPLALGAVAQVAGLGAALWLLLAGPVALLVGLPRRAE
jgi:FSR family fosmidomycin resistance protein-like MFS transporter